MLLISAKNEKGTAAVIVGLQFGDEGKGKITDYLSSFHDVVIRYNGGGNAGHTVVTDKGTFKFHLIPSGAIQSDTVILSNGMVIDVVALVEEIKKIRDVNPSLKIEVSRDAHVVTELHKYLDLAEEDARGALRIGTTAQGIGPTYEDKYGRSGIRISDLLDREILREKLLTITRMKRSLIEGSDYIYESKIDDLVQHLYQAGVAIRECITDTRVAINSAYQSGSSLLFEGAHGALLDIDYGVYPFVTSSNTIAGGISHDAGFSFRKVDIVIGVAKAYTSKVGNGTFPTEIKGRVAESLRQWGGEFGTTTGRPRRVGWLDITALKYALEINDGDFISLTKLDTLGKMEKISIGSSYTLNGDTLEVFPKNFRMLEKVKVEFEEMDSWGELDSGLQEEVTRKGYSGFPKQLREYVSRIEKLSGYPVKIISYGSRRDLTFDRSTFGAKKMDQLI